MNRIRWANNGECGSDNEWHGYLGKVHICTIDWSNAVFFYPVNHDYIEYSKLSSAKRGAERLLDRFLKDSGLEIKPDKDRIFNLLSDYGVAERYLNDLLDEIEECFVYEFEKVKS